MVISVIYCVIHPKSINTFTIINITAFKVAFILKINDNNTTTTTKKIIIIILIIIVTIIIKVNVK